jgi:hypothetical protein
VGARKLLVTAGLCLGPTLATLFGAALAAVAVPTSCKVAASLPAHDG